MKRENYERTSASEPPLWLRVSTLVLNADWFAFPHLAEQNPKRCSGPSGNWQSNLESRLQSECAQSVKSGQRRISIVSLSRRKRNDCVRVSIHAEMNVEWLKGCVYCICAVLKGASFPTNSEPFIPKKGEKKNNIKEYRMHRSIFNCMHFLKTSLCSNKTKVKGNGGGTKSSLQRWIIKKKCWFYFVPTFLNVRWLKIYFQRSESGKGGKMSNKGWWMTKDYFFKHLNINYNFLKL